MKLSWPAPNRRLGALDVLGAIGLFGLLVARFVPVAKVVPFWGCGFRTFTGYPCPGCGLTRAADHFAHFHFIKALQANPLGAVAAAAFAVLAVMMVVHLAFKVPAPEVELTSRQWRVLRYGAILALLVNYAFVIVQHRTHFWS